MLDLIEGCGMATIRKTWWTLVELHRFCDASEKADGACIFIVNIDFHGRQKSLLSFAKPKVARENPICPKVEITCCFVRY